MTKRHNMKLASATTLAAMATFLAACGGGGGGGDGGVINPPAPPASVTFTLALTDISLTDLQTNTSLVATGLPIDGAVATRNP